MTKFKVGDRVAVYDCDRYLGHVSAIDSDGRLWVLTEAGVSPTGLHPKQCRKLKPPKPRRRIWVQDSIHARTIYDNKDYAERDAEAVGVPCTEFIEVRRKKS